MGELRTTPDLLEKSVTPRRPIGVIAFLLAFGIAVAGSQVGQSYAQRLAGRYLDAVSQKAVPIKWESLTFQRAALASGHWLPIYGSSELYCCGDPFRGNQLFADQPTGFGLFAVGRAGTADLFFLQTFAALGGDLRGRRVVISDSPPWFFGPGGIGPKPYAGNYSPEIAILFAFDSPISTSVRKAAAQRMLAYPTTLVHQRLLRLALTDLANGSPPSMLSYAALVPLGRLDAWVLQLQDAYQTVRFIRDHPEMQPTQPADPHALDWQALLREGTDIAAMRGASNPFGFPYGVYVKLQRQLAFRRALRLVCSGQSNRNGELLPYPTGWARNMSRSAEWTDLALELRVLHEVGARPLAYTIPMPGLYDNETALSKQARGTYYQRYLQVTGYAHVPALAFRAHDEDRYFLNDTGAHFTPRGWIFADRALDLFWHGAPIGQIRAALAALNHDVPPVGLPSPATAPGCG